MIGGFTSSLALAQRTASQARVTMESMSRQIATGQKVATVKDDGAAWTRAAGIRSDNVTWEARSQALSLSSAAMSATKAMVEQVASAAESLRSLVLQARTYPAGSAQRQALQGEWNAIISQSVAIQGENPVLSDPTGIAGSGPSGPGHLVLQGDSYFGTTRMSTWNNYGAFHGWMTISDAWRPATLSTFNLVTASNAQLDDAHTSLMNVGVQATSGGASFASSWLTAIGEDEVQAERWQGDISRNIDRNDSAISSLTGADLGKVSAARAQAETRQQLALDTIKTALTAYGNYASGLLGNVQRTQRGVLA